RRALHERVRKRSKAREQSGSGGANVLRWRLLRVSTGITLRPATETDLAAISSLLRENRLPLDGVSDWVDDFIVADLDGKIVGSVAMERYGAYGLLRSAAVSETARGKGIGAT